ncbi:two-component regulator propeller domain-containing protein [Draconibacterium sp. IB214405]|uniref:ligand-binding sensor domain-containing protein n=1 Tax=Draconibacterium sp. IB214405 TaxID=3097352 RepID=UPI002A0DF38C|nr:two-component regulator propeller domain-containing protein [Draconibacterium sp. IB214405]MDX8337558.1 two-component regulator propeller domain-containing protein [Draconibacterium sp. IB214405]
MKQALFILLFIVPLFGFSQVKRIGIPNILNYPKSEYKAGTQNWGVAQDPDGFMYFANNDGLLRFDGKNWDLFNVSSTSNVRSVCIDDDGVIYIGMDNDFGIFNPTSDNGPVFTSLIDKLPEEVTETDVIWKIYSTQYGMVFQSYQYLFIYNNGKINVIKPERAFYYSFYINKRLFFHEPGVGLFEYINGFVNKVPWADELKDHEIQSMVSFFDNHLLIGTAQSGWFEYRNGSLKKWNVPANVQTEKDVLYYAVKLDGNNLAIGTILNGLIIANSDGEIIQHLNRKNGLQNNTILSLCKDRSGNLWLGLDNGIDYIELNSPISYTSGSEDIGTGYCSVIHDNLLYMGTNQGLFTKPFSPNGENNTESFKIIPGTEGQVWSLKVLNGQLFCGHNVGTFLINDRTPQLISEEPGAWTFIQLKEDPEYAIGGNFSGLSLYHFENNRWKFEQKINNFYESSRFLTEDKNGKIWISHGARGVFRVTLNGQKDSVAEVKLYGAKDGLPNDLNNILIKADESWYISSVNGIYSYNESSDRFIEDEKMNLLFQNCGRVKYLDKDVHGNYWFIAENNTGVLLLNDDGTYTRITTPFKQLINKLVREWEFLYVYDLDYVIFATEDGFAHYSSRVVASYNQPFKSFISKVDVPNSDTVIFPRNDDELLEFPFQKNAFRFHFSAPFYQNPEQLMFSYFIDNYSDSWSPWSSDNYRDITNLPENEYTFRVKARNSFDVVSEEASFSFVITPPWYRSKQAVYIYIFFVFVFVVIIAFIINKRFERSKRKEREKHEQELREREKEYAQQALLAEKEIIRLKNEKLEEQKISLDKELANQTLSIVNKNKFLMKINQELKHVSDDTTDGAVKSKMAILKKRINKEIDNEHQNKIFESYFEEVHNDFFKQLKDKYPHLSPKDLRLCAYIRMNMSTKEIATLLNISTRGVEISRYRLRKKLDISRDVNLSTYLLNL